MERQNEVQLDLDRMVLERDHVREEQQTLAHEIESELGPIELPDAVSHQLRLNLRDNTVELPVVEMLPVGLGAKLPNSRPGYGVWVISIQRPLESTRNC